MFLEIQQIKKHFGEGESRVDVLRGIDINIEKGEICVLLGPSGSGKSTLLHIWEQWTSLLPEGFCRRKGNLQFESRGGRHLPAQEGGNHLPVL